MDDKPSGNNIRFHPPDKIRLKEALGSLQNEDFVTKKALEKIDTYWQPIEPPGYEDWQHCYPRDGWSTYPKFGGKILNPGRFDTLYIMPIVWAKNSAITDKIMG